MLELVIRMHHLRRCIMLIHIARYAGYSIEQSRDELATDLAVGELDGVFFH